MATFETVQKIVEEKTGCNISDITTNAMLGMDLGCDSLDGVEVIMECEKQFKINISDVDAEKILTVGDLANAVDAELAKK